MEPTKELRKKVELWMLHNVEEYDNSTNLAEEAANVFDVYEDDVEYIIPEWVFEMSAEICPIDL